ncbi:MAG TPA: hypothetical protein V6D30_17540 [Leptolyngbyaceae cyanobacterium]
MAHPYHLLNNYDNWILKRFPNYAWNLNRVIFLNAIAFSPQTSSHP